MARSRAQVSPGILTTMNETTRPLVCHIPVCPFSQRFEILLALKGLRDAIAFHVVDITRPRPDWLLDRTGGTAAMPVLLLPGGAVIKESLVLLLYLEETFPEPSIARSDPLERAVERMLIALEGPFTACGYRFVMNRDRSERDGFVEKMLAEHLKLDALLRQHNPDGTFLFDDFGLAEAVFTPMFMRFWFLEYYEGFDLPKTEAYARVHRWREACLAHPCAQQVSREQIVKLYYDYALGAGNGALPEGRTVSSFAFEPHWSERPWPPRDKYGPPATDEELGLLED
jgi:glutathione S-transferase